MAKHGMIDQMPSHKEMGKTMEAMHGSSRAFWQKHSIRDKGPQPGNPDAGGKKKLPSKSTSLTPEKAREIISHGEVGGKKLTPRQRRFMGAVVSKGRR